MMSIATAAIRPGQLRDFEQPSSPPRSTIHEHPRARPVGMRSLWPEERLQNSGSRNMALCDLYPMP